MCGAIATGENATIYHQVTQNFEACFGATVVKGEYVQRYSGCGEEIPGTTAVDLRESGCVAVLDSDLLSA